MAALVPVLVAAPVGVFSVGFAVLVLGVVEALWVVGVLRTAETLRAVGVLRVVGTLLVASFCLVLLALLLAAAGEAGEVFAARATGGAGYAERRTVAGTVDLRETLPEGETLPEVLPVVLPEAEEALEPVLRAALELVTGGRGQVGVGFDSLLCNVAELVGDAVGTGDLEADNSAASGDLASAATDSAAGCGFFWSGVWESESDIGTSCSFHNLRTFGENRQITDGEPKEN